MRRAQQSGAATTMNGIGLEHLRGWIGRTRSDEDVIAARHARLMAATVGADAASIVDGAALPPLWHWLWFLEGLPPGQLGRDGHAERGGFLPPVPLSNRMWAGGRIAFIAPVRIGSTVRRRSAILNVAHKHGRSGDLVFVTVLHELSTPQGAPLLREEHDLVYRQPAQGTRPAATETPSNAVAPDGPDGSISRLTPDSTMLFRYSALTFNGHRIHYDADYSREVEGYPGLVIHGPLVATLLAAHAERIGGRTLRRYDYRCLAPAFLGDTIALHAQVVADRATLRASLPDGALSVGAEASFA